MQYIGNLKNVPNAKDVIGGVYSQSAEKSYRMDDSSHSSVYSKEFDGAVPYADSLDDILCSSAEDTFDGEDEYVEESKPVDTKRKFRSSYEDMEEFGSNSEEDADEHIDSYANVDPDIHDSNVQDAEVSFDEERGEGEDDEYHMSEDDVPEDHDYGVQEDHGHDDDEGFFEDIEKSSNSDEANDYREIDCNLHDGCASTASRDLATISTERSLRSLASSTRKVTFNEKIEPMGDTVITPKSRSLLRALQKVKENRSPVATTKVRKAPTPYHKPVAREPLNLPRSPPLRTPPRINRRPSSDHVASSPEVAQARSSVSSSPRNSLRMGNSRVTNGSPATKIGKTSPSRTTIVVKKNKQGLAIPEPPKLSQNSHRNYSTYSPEKLVSPRSYRSQEADEKIRSPRKATITEMKNNFFDNFRGYSPAKEKFVPRTTIPQPFSFITEERAAYRRLAHDVEGADTDKHYRPFKALAMPNYDNDPLFHGIVRMQNWNFVTAPEPFQLSIYKRANAMSAKRIQDDGDIGRYRFKALPVPDFSYRPLHSGHEVHLTMPFPFHLRIDERLASRIRFHGTKRSNLLAALHVACLIQKAKSLDALDRKEESRSKKVQPKTLVSLKPPTTPRRSSRNLSNTSDSRAVTNFKARKMPDFSKSPVTPSSVNSVNSNRSRASARTFKALQPPDFSKPFSPTMKPKSPARYISIASPSNGLNFPDMPMPSKNTPSPAKSVGSIRSTTGTFKARRMPDFSKPFFPIKKPPSPANSVNVMQSLSSGTSIAKRDTSEPSTPGSSVSSQKFNFIAKKMPKTFVPAKTSPRAVKSAPSTPYGRAKLSTVSDQALQVMPMSCSTEPFDPWNQDHFVSSSSPGSNRMKSEQMRNRQPLAVKTTDTANDFKARPMPNFTKPFLPVKRSTIEEALVKAVEDKSILDILNQKLYDYKARLATEEYDDSNDRDVRGKLKDLADEAVHKVLKYFLNTAKSVGVEADYSTLSQDISLDSLTDPSQDSSYAAMADYSSRSASVSDSLNNESADQHLSESTLGESDFSLASQSSGEVDISYPRSLHKINEDDQKKSEENDLFSRREGGDRIFESGKDDAKIKIKNTKICRPCENDKPDRDIPLQPVDDQQEYEEEGEEVSCASSCIALDQETPEHIEAGTVRNNQDAMDISLDPTNGLPPLHMKADGDKCEERAHARMVAMIDRDLDSGSVSSHGESSCAATADVSESAMPLLKVMNRLNETMKKLSVIDKESDKFISRNSSPVPEKITMETGVSNISNEESIVDKSSENTEQELHPARDLSAKEVQCQGLEVDNGYNCIELRSPRADFGDDFGSDTDTFRAGWKRALQHMELRDTSENCGDNSTTSKMVSLSAITEEIAPDLSAQQHSNSTISRKVQAIAGHCYERQSVESTAFDFSKHAVDKKLEDDPKSSIFDSIIHCCSGKALRSPTAQELPLLEDGRDDDDCYVGTDQFLFLKVDDSCIYQSQIILRK